MNLILIGGSIALLAALGGGACLAWRARAAQRRILVRLEEYAGR